MIAEGCAVDETEVTVLLEDSLLYVKGSGPRLASRFKDIEEKKTGKRSQRGEAELNLIEANWSDGGCFS